MKLLCWLALASLLQPAEPAKKKGSAPKAELLELTDETLEDALASHPLLLLSVSVPDCEVCQQVERRLQTAGGELRVKAKSAVSVGRLMITSQNSPVIARIVQGQLTLPKLIVFREGEAMDYTGDVTKESIVKTMLRETSRDTVQTFKSVKQAERFLHLDSWAAQHADEEKPPRVVGFFPSNETAGYAVYRSAARKLQGLIAFGECFDAAIQKKFLGQPARKSVIQLVKNDNKERKLTYEGKLAPSHLARWIATHSVTLVQDLSTESSIESHMALGVPLFLLLMPDSYEEQLGGMMPHFRSVMAPLREKLLFGYGFKDTEPWPQFAQQLGLDRSNTGAFWMIVGNNMDVTGRDWDMAWLRPPSLGFQIYAMEARNSEKAKDVTEAKIQTFVNGFLEQVDSMLGPEPEPKGLVVETEVEVAEAPAAEGGESAEVQKARNYDKELRNKISSLQMNFNSGLASLKKALDELVDTPQLLPGRVPTLTSTVQNMELKLKKDVLELKRQLMDIGKRKDEL